MEQLGITVFDVAVIAVALFGALIGMSTGFAHAILFIASCSHHVGTGEFTDAVVEGLGRARRDGRILGIFGAGPDHPVHPALPESAYLKGVLLHLS